MKSSGRSEMKRVVTSDGLQGHFDAASDVIVNGEPHVIVQLDNGWELLVPTHVLVAREDGFYVVPLDAVDESINSQASSDSLLSNREREEIVIPVIAEEVDILTRQTKSRVRVIKRVHQREEVIDEPGFTEDVQIERVVVNQPVDKPPQVRYEGDVMIIPVLEEVVVVERRLVLKEELYVHRRRHETRNPQRVTLRAEQVDVERVAEDTPVEQRDESLRVEDGGSNRV